MDASYTVPQRCCTADCSSQLPLPLCLPCFMHCSAATTFIVSLLPPFLFCSLNGLDLSPRFRSLSIKPWTVWYCLFQEVKHCSSLEIEFRMFILQKRTDIFILFSSYCKYFQTLFCFVRFTNVVVLPFVANYKYAKSYQILIWRDKICFSICTAKTLLG